MEHVRHIGNVCSIEVSQVERFRFQRFAVIEHAAHVNDIFGIKVSYILDILQFHAALEPRSGGGGAIVGKGPIEHSVLDLFLRDSVGSCPARSCRYFSGHVVRGSRTCAAQVVVVECERGVGLGEYGVSLLCCHGQAAHGRHEGDKE